MPMLTGKAGLPFCSRILASSSSQILRTGLPGLTRLGMSLRSLAIIPPAFRNDSRPSGSNNEAFTCDSMVARWILQPWLTGVGLVMKPRRLGCALQGLEGAVGMLFLWGLRAAARALRGARRGSRKEVLFFDHFLVF